MEIKAVGTFNMEALRVCKDCGLSAYTREDLDDFKKSTTCTYGRSPQCKECGNKEKRERQQTPEGKQYHRNAAYKRNFGITLQDYDEMFKKQRGRCDICGTKNVGDIKNKHFHVDHNHKTGEVRGLLCAHCNKGLGHFKDEPTYLAKAIKYLNKGRREF